MKMCSAIETNGENVILIVPSTFPSVSDVFTYYNVNRKFKIKRAGLNTKSSKINRLSFILSSTLFAFLSKSTFVLTRDLYVAYLLSFIKPVYFEIHAPILGVIKKTIFSKLSKNKNLIKLISITDALGSYIVKNHNVQNNKLLILPDGADLPINEVDIKFTTYENNILNVGYVGHLYKGKGLEIISKLSNRLKSEDGVKLHVVGGNSNDINFWKENSNSKFINFYGFVSQKKVASYINAMDVCLLPNQKVVLPNGTTDLNQNISDFTSPLKMFEYMAHGKPIIASKLPVLCEVLNESNSILVSPESDCEWLDAIFELRDKNQRIRLGEKAKYDFEKYYTWEERARKILLDHSRSKG